MQTASFYHMLSVIYLLIIARTIVLVQIDFLFQFVLNHDMLLFTPFSVTRFAIHMQMAGRQTLDSNSPNGTAHRNEQESPQSCNSEGFCFFSSLHGISSHSLATVSIC